MFTPTPEQMRDFNNNKRMLAREFQKLVHSQEVAGEFTQEHCNEVCAFIEGAEWPIITALLNVFSRWYEMGMAQSVIAIPIILDFGQEPKITSID